MQIGDKLVLPAFVNAHSRRGETIFAGRRIRMGRVGRKHSRCVASLLALQQVDAVDQPLVYHLWRQRDVVHGSSFVRPQHGPVSVAAVKVPAVRF